MIFLYLIFLILFFSKDFTGSVIEDHLCGFERIDCDYKCGQKIQRNRLKAHQINTCSKRLITCSYCSRDFTGKTFHKILYFQLSNNVVTKVISPITNITSNQKIWNHHCTLLQGGCKSQNSKMLILA